MKLLIFILLSIIFSNPKADENDISSIEIDANGQQQEIEKPQHPNGLEVIFENQSGKKVELYWDNGSKIGVLQNELTHTSQITINTYIGHTFYFTPENSNGTKNIILYSVTMERHMALITLHTPDVMKQRNQEFEIKKNIWMKEYYKNTSRRWKNYYPRKPVTHYMWNFTEIGQTITVRSTHGQFHACSDSEIESDSDVSDARETYFHNATGVHFCRTDEYKDVTINVVCTDPKVAYFDGFLSDDECEHIISVGSNLGLKRSTVSEEALTTEDRTSSTVWIERSRSYIIDEIVKRIADVIKIDERKLFLNQSSESLQLVHYYEGELYKAHVDYGTDRPHNRYVTFLMYLNSPTSGGHTSFPKAPKACRDEDNRFSVQPIKGRVAFFYNLLLDGNVDDTTQHYAEPPTDGNEKWMSNLWIWDELFTR